MTKKVSKKNILCLFPPKTGQLKTRERSQSLQLGSESARVDYPPAPESTSDWQTHYDYLEMSPWGSGLFGAPMERSIEEMAWRALELAAECGDKYKVAKSYRHLFYLYCEFNHPMALEIGSKSVVAAVHAYGHSTAEVGEELAMLAVVHEFHKNYDQATLCRDTSIKIFAKVGTTKRLFEALEMAICSASDLGRKDKVEEYARKGIRLVRKRCKKGSDEYTENIEYFKEMLATVHELSVPIEEQQRQLFSIFPKLQEMFEGKN